MKAYRYLVLLFCGLSAACTLDEGDTPPRKTQGEHEIYTTVWMINTRAMTDLRVIAGFDLYLRQTTDAGRLAVVKSVFGWAHISEPESGSWTVETPGVRYDFITSHGILLGEPGAQWKYYRGGDGASPLKGELTTEDGSIRYNWMGVEQASVDWLVDAQITETGFDAKASGRGRYEYKLENGDRWAVAYQIDKPLLWELPNQMVEGELSVEAELTGNTPREIAFKAICLSDGVRILTPEGVDEIWMD